MHDIDIEEELVLKVGGKFALTSLIQKRMVELNRGSPPLIQLEGEHANDLRRIVAQEILHDKIELAQREAIGQALEQKKPAPEPAAVEAPAAQAAPEGGGEEGDDVEIYGSDIKKIKEQRIKELSQLLNPKK